MSLGYKITFLFTLCLFFACEEPGTNTSDTGNNISAPASNQGTDALQESPIESSQVDTPSSVPEPKDCAVADIHHKKNIFLAKDVAQQICIVANQSTHDKELGDSHRILRIVDTKDCSTIFEKTLPVDRSPDFPYYLIPQTYEPKNGIIAIQGYSSAYYYNVKNEKLTGPIEPKFLNERDAVDPQSGMVKGLKVWEHYLMGHCVDYGNFAFDIADPNNPKPVLPVAEYKIPKTEEYNYLFLLETKNGFYQAILPTTDIDAGGNMFDLDRMFRQTLKINNKVARNVQNNRYIILNDNSDPNQARKVVIDMFSKKQVDLPDNVALLKAGEVLNWLSVNNQ